jgi:hypothetical protein
MAVGNPSGLALSHRQTQIFATSAKRMRVAPSCAPAIYYAPS